MDRLVGADCKSCDAIWMDWFLCCPNMADPTQWNVSLQGERWPETGLVVSPGFMLLLGC